MKNLLKQFNPVLENRVRLAVMSLLLSRGAVEFNIFKEVLGVTDGNLASHLATLEQARYLSVTKSFHGRKPKTMYRCTAAGRKAFAEHRATLELLMNSPPSTP